METFSSINICCTKTIFDGKNKLISIYSRTENNLSDRRNVAFHESSFYAAAAD
jgi:hypothetical protein